MKKIFLSLFLTLLLSLTILIITLSTFGVETNRFNKIISQKINDNNNSVNLNLKTIKYKLDIKELSLFLETLDPELNYRGIIIPSKSIKVYLNFASFIKLDTKIKKINIVFEKIDLEQFKRHSILLKPSNFSKFLQNNVNKGLLDTDLEIYLDRNNLLSNFIARGTVTNLEANLLKDINLKKVKFDFFADKSDILLKNFYGSMNFLNILDGDIKLDLSQNIDISSNFTTKIKFESFPEEYKNLIKNFKFVHELKNLNAELSNNISLSFDKTYKVKEYNIKSSGKITNAELNLDKPVKNIFSKNNINQLSFKNLEINSNFNKDDNTINILGKYSLNKTNFLNFKVYNNIKNKISDIKFDFEYNEAINIDLINYKKVVGKLANFSINLNQIGKNLIFNKIYLEEEKNYIRIHDIKFEKGKFSSLEKIEVKTNKNKTINNNFIILFGKKILIKGSKFDATNLPQILYRKTDTENFNQISNDIEVTITDVIAPMSESITNFKLIGKIKNGKFVKISSKGDFGQNKFLDISMKNDEKNKKKYLEIYSDIPKPLLTEFNFFNGLIGGNLLFNSVIDEKSSSSKLTIENFKVANAPGMIKLLTLADLRGLADLADGEGISFDTLEIKMEKTKEVLKLDEILALGPSISVLMEGYQDSEVTSLRGTLVPAKTLNKMISKIPVIGDIVIPKEVGEGLFGISFKMKGSKGNIKTTINPIRTLTPRFIQKIVDRKKRPK